MWVMSIGGVNTSDRRDMRLRGQCGLCSTESDKAAG